jgi:hypothetical protein
MTPTYIILKSHILQAELAYILHDSESEEDNFVNSSKGEASLLGCWGSGALLGQELFLILFGKCQAAKV